MGANPKSAKIQSNGQSFFDILGSAGIKAAHKMLMKLAPGDHSAGRMCPSGCEIN